jgi:hypothetical protein
VAEPRKSRAFCAAIGGRAGSTLADAGLRLPSSPVRV